MSSKKQVVVANSAPVTETVPISEGETSGDASGISGGHDEMLDNLGDEHGEDEEYEGNEDEEEGDEGDEEEEDEEGGDQGEENVDQGPRIDKPQIWVRIKPGAMDTNLYEIGDDLKTLKLTIKPEDRLFQKKVGETACFSFETEGILHSSNQEDLYEVACREIVDNALEGVSGVVAFVGPEGSGKTFSLFGLDGDYQLRGVLPRAIEDIFGRLESKISKGEFHIILSMFEVRKDKIKDLITLGTNELTRVGNFGPKGLFFEEVSTVDHALGLILRGLVGQQQIPCDVHPAYAKYHTLIYVDILANAKVCGFKQESWKSRITFAKIAAMSSKAANPKKLVVAKETKSVSSLYRNNCSDTTSTRKDNCFSTDGIARRCCGGPQGPAAERIATRKDMYFLEQMFTKCYDLQKINEYYNELSKLGMYMLRRPPNTNPSQYFRQSKLAHCLKDIISGNALVRLILHVRPVRAFLHSTLEVMRFAERARYIPCEITRKHEQGDSDRKICEDTGVNPMDHPEGMVPEKLKEAFKAATTYFEEKLDTLEGPCKDQVKVMFDGFQEMMGSMLDKEVVIDPEHHVKGENADEDAKANEGDTDALESASHKSLTSESKKAIKGSQPTKKNKIEKEESIKSLDKNEDKKNKKRAVRTSVSRIRNKGRQDAKDVDDSGDMNKKRDRSLNKKSVTQVPKSGDDIEDEEEDDATGISVDGASQDLSISVIPHTGATEPTDGNGIITNLHFKCKCWEKFSKTDAGNLLVTDFGEKQNLLKQYMADHNETLKEVVNALSKLVAIELNLDSLDPNRRFSDDTTEMTTMITTKEQRKETAAQAQRDLKKLQDQKANIRTLVSELEFSKQECEKAFDIANPNYCNDSMKTDFAARKTIIDGELKNRYDDIYKVAKREAQILIRKNYLQRPPWTMFY